MFKRLLSIFTLTGIFIVTIGAVSTHDANAGEQHGRSFVGSFIVNGTDDGGVFPPFTNVTTNTKDGAVINTAPDLGTGHGAWKPIGHGKVSIKFIHLVPLDNPDFPPGSFLTVTATLDVGHGGASPSGPFLSVFEHPDIGELFRITGTVEFERITADHCKGHHC